MRLGESCILKAFAGEEWRPIFWKMLGCFSFFNKVALPFHLKHVISISTFSTFYHFLHKIKMYKLITENYNVKLQFELGIFVQIIPRLSLRIN